MRQIYFKRKAGEPILVSDTGILLPDIIITPTIITVDVFRKMMNFTWSFFYDANAYFNGNTPLVSRGIGIREFHFVFTNVTNPTFQNALDQIDWLNGGEFSEVGAQVVLDFYGTQPDPTTPLDDEDNIYDHWDGMIYNG